MAHNKFAAAVASVAASAVAAVVPACAGTPGDDTTHPAGFDQDLAHAIGGIGPAGNVERYLASLREETFTGTGNEKFGVMVCKTTGGRGYTMNASAVAFQTVSYDGDRFGIWLIQPGSGTFTNHREHAHRNWTFVGYQRFDPDTRTVQF
ncbi:hypothetical protein JK358_38640 [Nocardia sp. 2]|uniref:Lipoprotein n=1 Tax=Nocardia acididurans TaxID=2802282 RepID=A0ABS1MJ84_9NOCA|nr:hypothetical protein [Nocardia acididurans]MBL1080331.1 hypothetical protein [Nocardia acididurans]